jgi:hypothetical protein
MMHILEKEIGVLTSEFPQLTGFFSDYGINFNEGNSTFGEYLDQFPEEFYEDIGIDRERLLENLDGFLQHACLLESTEPPNVSEIT